MKLKQLVTPGMVIFMLGFCGLVFLLIDDAGEIGSKIPMAVMFIFIILIGAFVEFYRGDMLDDTFGEKEAPRGFG